MSAPECALMGPELLQALAGLVVARDAGYVGPVVVAALRVADALGMDEAETSALLAEVIEDHRTETPGRWAA